MGGILAFRDKGLSGRIFHLDAVEGNVVTDREFAAEGETDFQLRQRFYGGNCPPGHHGSGGGLYECGRRVPEGAEQQYLVQGFSTKRRQGVVPLRVTYINMDEFFDGNVTPVLPRGGLQPGADPRYGTARARPELGDFSMEHDLKTPEQQKEVCNVVRFAINSQLSREHLDYVIAAVTELRQDRKSTQYEDHAGAISFRCGISMRFWSRMRRRCWLAVPPRPRGCSGTIAPSSIPLAVDLDLPPHTSCAIVSSDSRFRIPGDRLSSCAV